MTIETHYTNLITDLVKSIDNISHVDLYALFCDHVCDENDNPTSLLHNNFKELILIAVNKNMIKRNTLSMTYNYVL